MLSLISSIFNNQLTVCYYFLNSRILLFEVFLADPINFVLIMNHILLMICFILIQCSQDVFKLISTSFAYTCP